MLEFNDVDGKTELVHTGELIWRTYPVLGWLVGLLYAKPMFERVIEKFMRQIKATSEGRAVSTGVSRDSQAVLSR